MKLDRANSGPEPPAAFLRAIRHGVAAGACRQAARATGNGAWGRTAAHQRGKAKRCLHYAATAVGTACASASTSRVMPSPFD